MTGDGLVDEMDYIEAVIKMGSAGYMNTQKIGATSDANMVAGKREWIQEYNDMPDTLDIVMKGQDVEGDGGLQKTRPTAQFIYQEIKACEDVEVGFPDHWITAYGIGFTDEDDDDFFDPEETGFLRFIDPWGGVPGQGALKFEDGWWKLEYHAGDWRNVEIVVSESPVPEPMTMLGLFLGVSSVGAYIRRRVRGMA